MPDRKTRARIEAEQTRGRQTHEETSTEAVGLLEWLRWKFGIPFKKRPFAPYFALLGGKRRGIVLTGVEVVLLIAWVLMYKAAASWLGLVRLNNLLLSDAIKTGSAKPVSSVTGDGAVVTKDGLTYPPGSVEHNAEISHYFKTAYYSPKELTLLAPLDAGSIMRLALPVLACALASCLFWFAMRAVLTIRHREAETLRGFLTDWYRRFVGTKRNLLNDDRYSQITYNYTPLSIRLLRTVTILLMIETVAAWFWPLL